MSGAALSIVRRLPGSCKRGANGSMQRGSKAYAPSKLPESGRPGRFPKCSHARPHPPGQVRQGCGGTGAPTQIAPLSRDFEKSQYCSNVATRLTMDLAVS